ncbi:MAG: hypothetical protein PUB52_05770 [Lachnospiraceae bacterium]|nr:hypothetical protein [Lachnospiraceae bacterium]
MKYELIGVKNGIELYGPVAENRQDELELKAREDRFCNFMAEIILKYYDKFATKIAQMNDENLKSVDQ